jgi:alkanesulfonate monooxygenase SsuD/methylene tetrahydromethanopterin reductase-like flavin-dependent oxidoreductase (luciferase family)
MFIGKFIERAYQDPRNEDMQWRARQQQDNSVDMSLSNSGFDGEHGATMYHRYLDEHCYADEMGFDAIMLNEHHNGPFCMGAQPNIEAGILARITKRVKIVMLGNVLPLWDDPILLAEQLAEIDMISRGRLVNGWVRGTGRESVAHTSQTPYNFERLEEAHALIQMAWSVPGPFRWEGEHYHFREVNPWVLPYQKPVPAHMACGLISKNSMEWAARRHYPYVMLATEMNATRAAFEYYQEVAREEGYEASSQHFGYLLKAHVDETDDLAYDVGKNFVRGRANPFNEGNEGRVRGFMQNPPGYINRGNLLPTVGADTATGPRLAAGRAIVTAENDTAAERRAARRSRTYDELVEANAIIVGSPKTVIEKVKRIMDFLRVGSIFFWDGEGAMTHQDSMRSIRLMGQEVIPALKEYAKEIGIHDPFEVDPGWKSHRFLEATTPQLVRVS